ncbi:transmembrane amino acid transporter protein-domain-containing protein, partial [Dimargaris cristalligena]
ATVFSCVVNLCNTILGSGILAMPTAMASVGLLLGSWIILFSAAASALGLFFLGYCARFVEGRHASFFTVSQLTYPGASLFFDLAIAIKCFGVSISYLIIFGEVMPQVMSALFIPEPLNVVTYAKTDPSFLFLLLTDRRFWITLAILLLTPLAFLRRLDSLRYTSMVALVALLYLVVIVLVNFLDPARTPVPAGRVSLIKLSPQFFTNLPIFVFAFTCHQNIFSVYNELRDNSPRNIKGTIHLAISVATVAYLIVAILGYLQFGDDVLPNIILMYHSGPLVTLGQVAIGVLMLLSYPLQCHPCRACLDKIICGYVLPRHSGRSRPLSLASTGNIVPPAMSRRMFIAVTICILFFSYLVAMSVSQLDLVLSFVGSTGSTTISFILPGLFFYKI